MKYEKMKNNSEGKFRRITGIRRKTFGKIIKILKDAEAESGLRVGLNPNYP